MESEDTRLQTEKKAAPGKKFVKTVKTRYITVDGYMQAEDYSSYDEVDDIKPAVKAKPAPAQKIEKKPVAKAEKK